MLTGAAPAKLNLALVIGGLQAEGKHEVVTVVDQLALADTVTVARATELRVDGYAEDTLVTRALDPTRPLGEPDVAQPTPEQPAAAALVR